MHAGSGSDRPVHRWHAAMWVAIALLLLLPLTAMQVTREVAWTSRDFVFAAVLLGGGGLAGEAVLRLVRDRTRRHLAVGLILLVILLMWADGAVGIF